MLVTVELSGGVELLFGKQKKLAVDVPPSVSTLGQFIRWLASSKYLTERPELFIAGDSVRPGILVLVNDADWELEGQGAYALQDADVIAFISTLHGG